MIGKLISRVGVAIAMALLLAFIAANAMVTAQELPEAQSTPAPRGDLVVVPKPVAVGQTVTALAYHMVPVNLGVAIEYSEHFTPDGESCGGSPGATPSASSTLWVTLNACTAGTAYVRLVEAGTRSVIKEVSVTVTRAGTRQAVSETVTVTGPTNLLSVQKVARGTYLRYEVAYDGLDSSEEYSLRLVASEGVSFGSDCDYSNYPGDFVLTPSLTGFSQYGRGNQERYFVHS